MTLTNERYPRGISSPLSKNHINEYQCGFTPDQNGNLVYFIGVDFQKSLDEESLVYFLMQELIVENLQVPIQWTTPIFNSDLNTFGANFNVSLDEDGQYTYSVILCAVIDGKPLYDVYSCLFNSDAECDIVNRYVGQIEKCRAKGTVHKAN